MEADRIADYPVGELVNAGPAKRPSRITLTGRHVTIAPLDPAAHAEALFEGSSGGKKDNLWAYLFAGPFRDRDSFDSYLADKASCEDPLLFTIVDNRTRRAAGMAAYMRIETAHRVIEIGNILYTPRLQRSAGATEAMYLMAWHAFEDLGYRRYEWKCNALNAPSRRAAVRLGFTFEGVFRQHFIVKGRNRDTAWYSMLDHEWPARKRAFEEWLKPANFDPDGKQQRPLSDFMPDAGS